MVRHEAAEALGGIASDGAEEKGEDVLAILREWAVKPEAPVVVRESCQVAIDMWEVSDFSSFSLPHTSFSHSMSCCLRSQGGSDWGARFLIWTWTVGYEMMLMDSTKTPLSNSTHSINSKLRVM